MRFMYSVYSNTIYEFRINSTFWYLSVDLFMEFHILFSSFHIHEARKSSGSFIYIFCYLFLTYFCSSHSTKNICKHIHKCQLAIICFTVELGPLFIETKKNTSSNLSYIYEKKRKILEDFDSIWDKKSSISSNDII